MAAPVGVLAGGQLSEYAGDTWTRRVFYLVNGAHIRHQTAPPE
jgi:hypothetical protein